MTVWQTNWLDAIRRISDERGSRMFTVRDNQTFEFRQTDFSDKVVLAGAFNPLHSGHLCLLKTSAQFSGREGYFEISISNADKGDMTSPELEERVTQILRYAPVAVTSAPLFIQKARLMLGAQFVMGADTLERFLNNSYYDGGDVGLYAIVEELKRLKCTILVAGRLDTERVFQTLGKMDIATKIKEGLILELPERLFRNDISSTLVRNGSKLPRLEK